MLGTSSATYTPAHLDGGGEASDEVCRAFRNNGRCRYGDDCKFVHSEGEPIAPPEQRERSECFTFRDAGECEYGDRCRFSHGPDDTRHTGNIADEVCRNYLMGRCKLGDECLRKHEGEVEERAPRQRKRNKKRGECYDFRDGNCERGEECRFSHGQDEDEDDNEEGEGADNTQTKKKRIKKKKGPGECFDFRDGNCERGDECRFSHEPAGEGDGDGEDGGRPRRTRTRVKKGPGECFDFRDGTCERGEECRFSHGGEPPANTSPRPRGECYDYRDGKCERGESCRFSHDLAADGEAQE